jgi:hypothetical protein
LKRLAFIIPFAVLVSIFLPRCAVVVAPTGGDKDTIPPVLVKSDPAINATNFRKDKVLLTFDEFIRLDQITQKMVLSPPQEQLPEFKIKGKSLELKFVDPLLENTTYTVYLADAIIDNNEGNKLLNFEFAFSTGPVIDSLRYVGKVIDAFTLQPQEGIFVMLYNSFEDSIPMKERPLYVTKTNKEGQFFLSNIKHDNYKLFALRDGNSNYKFDQVAEEIGFKAGIIDTSMLLTPSQAKTKKDSLFVVRLFAEENRVIALTDYSRKQRRKMRLGFSRKPEGEVVISPINVKVDSSLVWYQVGKNVKGDSLDFWIINTDLSKIDTLVIGATYFKTDSLMNLKLTTDTLRMFYMERTQQLAKRGRRDDDVEKGEVKPSLAIRPSIKSGSSIAPHEKLQFRFNMPLLNVNEELVSLMDLADSTLITSPILKDTLNPTLYSMHHNWEPFGGYNLKAYPGAFVDLDGATNDTLSINFVGADPEKFGVIIVNLTGVSSNVITEIVTEKGAVIDKKEIGADGKLRFTFIPPGKYLVRFIIDENNNGKWDTGWYLQGIQPERVIHYQEKSKEKLVNIRANWEYSLDYNIN